MSPTMRKRKTSAPAPGGAGAGREAEGINPKPSSAGIIHDSHLPNHRDLDLARILHRLLDLLHHIACQARRGEIVHDLRLDRDTHLAARLNGEGAFDAGEGVRDAL